jgi:ParB-like chromosome segregation protein Spo0J
MSTAALGFIPEPLTVPVVNVLPSRRLSPGVITLRKFRQIKRSIEEVGMIEPLSVMAGDPTVGPPRAT